jgi:Butirosin biosynthesis protein H, N-terminal/Domain of unknown function (DUF4872)
VSTAPARVEIPYPHRRAGHCGSGSFRDLLEFHGLCWGEEPLSEGMAFGLGAGLGLAYVELPPMEPPLYLVGRTGGLERDVCEHLGIGLDLRQTEDPDEGWRWVREELDAGRPTMIWADIGELEYLRVRLRMTMHDIVVVGYDEEQGIALIADNDRDEIQHSTLEGLARARNSTAFPGPNRHATWVMTFPEALPEPAPTIREAIAGAVDNMRSGGRGLEDTDVPRGLEAAEALAAAYPDWPARFGDKLPSALKGLQAYIVKAGTGGALFRSLHAGFLHDAGALLGDSSLDQLGDLYDELAAAWVAFAGAAETGEHASGLPFPDRIAELERAGVEAMEHWLVGAGDGRPARGRGG